MTREERKKAIKVLDNMKVKIDVPKAAKMTKNDKNWALDVAIKALSQEPKIGHWILADKQNKEDVENDNYRFICSECQCSDIHAKGIIVPYCWKCGVKMESEDKE